MREIKFREWGTERETMVVGVREEYDDSVGFRFAHEEGGERILMQCTGAKDFNDVEIYEGDIIQGCFKSGKFFKGTVVYEKALAAFVLSVIEFPIFEFQLSEIYYPKVIGNIYENPELMEG